MREPAAAVLTQQFVLGIYGIRLVALYGLFIGGCTGPAGPAAAPTPTTAAPTQVPATTSAPPISPAGRVVTMRCSEAISRQPPAAADVVLGAVALQTRWTLQAYGSGESGWMAKHGLVVRAEAAVELLVAPAAAGRARIGWGHGGTMGTHVRWPGCTPETGWLAFAGGYQVNAPMCVPLVVRSGGREAQVGIGVGVGCPSG